VTRRRWRRPPPARYPAIVATLAAKLLLAAASVVLGQGPAAEERRLELVARRFRLPPAEVRLLRARGLEWRDVEHALALSEKTGEPVSELLKLREDGRGWGRIAVERGVRLEDLKRDEPRR
jgi:hypothetical protein